MDDGIGGFAAEPGDYMDWSKRLQHVLLWAGWAVSAVLLGRFAVDFWRGMPVWLGAPFALLVAATLGVLAYNLRAARRGRPRVARPAEAALLGAVPLGFIVSALDCMGLALEGCAPFCTFVKLGWVPALAGVAALYLAGRRPVWLTLLAAMSFVPLVPHCVCYNAGNGFWIDRLGASPTCYAWGFTAGLVAISALGAGRRWPSWLLLGAILGGGLTFFVAHHFFRFPW